jgi:transcriptional regulator with XRE-family HTH domain
VIKVDAGAYMRLLGRRLRLLRVDRDLTQDMLARRIGMSRNFLSALEAGAHGVDVVRLLALAAALEVSLAALVDDTSDSLSPALSAD